MKSYTDIKFITATVTSNFSKEQNGTFKVKSADTYGDDMEVIYTSPSYLLNGGGVISIPEVGSEVLVLQDLEKHKNYYIATIVDYPPKDISSGDPKFTLIGDPYIYSERDKPQKVTFTNSANAGLKISRRALPEYISCKVDLDSEGGKRISLSDSDNADWVLIRNEHGDSIVLTGEANDIFPERSLEVKTKGSQQFVTFESGMHFYVIDGRDFTIENYSSGANANTTASDKGRFGNITLRSYEKDINIVAKGGTSQIFITTPKARIVVQEDGSVNIESLGSVNIKSQVDINLEAINSINLKAANVNISADLNTAIQSGGIFSSKSTGIAAIDGAQVHWNSQLSLPVVPVPIQDSGKNDYGE